MATLLTGIQLINVAGLAVILLVAVLLLKRWPDSHGLIIPPVLWAGYGVVFYGFVLSGRLSAEAVLLWGAIHRMLAVFMILGALVALWFILDAPEVEDD